MARRQVHTVPDGKGGWINRTAGSERGFGAASTKAAAQAAGRQSTIRTGGEHVIHNLDGKISGKNTYPRSSDPRNIKG